MDGASRFVLHWYESGGPPVSLPLRKGLGTRLIEAGLSGTRNTQVALTYQPEGVRFEIATDLAGLQTEQ